MSANDQVIEQDWRRAVGYGNGTWQRELRGQVTRGQAMGYRVQIDHRVCVGTKDGQPYSLVGALAAVFGCENARVIAPDGRTVAYVGRRSLLANGRRPLDRYRVGYAASAVMTRRWKGWGLNAERIV